MEVFLGKKFTFAIEWLRKKDLQGLAFKACSLVADLAFYNNTDHQIWHLISHVTNLA